MGDYCRTLLLRYLETWEIIYVSLKNYIIRVLYNFIKELQFGRNRILSKEGTGATP